MEYIAYLHKDKNSDFGVSFPDFPRCITAGKTLDEARRMAAEALAFHIKGLSEDGEVIPEPSKLDNIAEEAAKHNDRVHGECSSTGRHSAGEHRRLGKAKLRKLMRWMKRRA